MPFQSPVRLSSGMQVEVDPSEWPEIGDVQWTAQRDSVLTAHPFIRRHADDFTSKRIQAKGR